VRRMTQDEYEKLRMEFEDLMFDFEEVLIGLTEAESPWADDLERCLNELKRLMTP
jgi:cobalamin biosynthesis Co2+ chelatase CbiK